MTPVAPGPEATRPRPPPLAIFRVLVCVPFQIAPHGSGFSRKAAVFSCFPSYEPSFAIIRPACGERFGVPSIMGKATPMEGLTSSLDSLFHSRRSCEEEEVEKTEVSV